MGNAAFQFQNFAFAGKNGKQTLGSFVRIKKGEDLHLILGAAENIGADEIGKKTGVFDGAKGAGNVRGKLGEIRRKLFHSKMRKLAHKSVYLFLYYLGNVLFAQTA